MSADSARILVIDDEKQIRRVLTVSLARSSHGLRGGHGSGGTEPGGALPARPHPSRPGAARYRRHGRGAPAAGVDADTGHHSLGEGGRGGQGRGPRRGRGRLHHEALRHGGLLARIRVALRRNARERTSRCSNSESLTVDLPRRLVTVRGQKLKLGHCHRVRDTEIPGPGQGRDPQPAPARHKGRPSPKGRPLPPRLSRSSGGRSRKTRTTPAASSRSRGWATGFRAPGIGMRGPALSSPDGAFRGAASLLFRPYGKDNGPARVYLVGVFDCTDCSSGPSSRASH